MAEAGQVEIPLTAGVDLKATLTGDRKYVLVRDKALPDSPWRLYRTDTRAEGTAIPYEPSAREVNVIGRTIYYVVDDAEGGSGAIVLKARSLDAGNILWEKSFRRLGKKTLPKPPRPGAAQPVVRADGPQLFLNRCALGSRLRQPGGKPV